MDINEVRDSVITDIHNLTLDQVNVVKTFIEFLKYKEELSSKDLVSQHISETHNEEYDFGKEFPGLFDTSAGT
ncbi:hypothetical protein FD724_08600 [Nostoc sp. C057]|uniref:hypothetical protein n=1 Tax=Nostoc sp. C057 TaxID=2576903 RepID=UPI0015C33A05|nr:hypothetical protein [Nostoc sp. C057]QLE48174.1 hypothetical protein FD724_08600 [Nostoc sp. C057]